MGRARKQGEHDSKTRPRRSFAKAARRVALAALFGIAAVGCTSNGPKAIERPPPDKIESVMPSAPELPPAPRDSTDYHQQIFRHNAAAVLTPFDNLRLMAMTRNERMDFYMERLCFVAGEQAPQGATQEQLRDAMEDLSRLTILGKPLVGLAIENNVKICSLDRLPPGFAAQYFPALDAVVAGPQASRTGRALTLAHEIIHAAQDSNRLLSYGYNWDMQSRVTRNLSVEAAAVAGEYLLAFEAKLAGDDSYWNYLTFRRANSTALKNAVADAYDASVRAGAKPEAALRDAGRAAFEEVFNNPWWRDFYLNEELRAYLADIDEGRFDRARTTGHYQFGQQKINLSGAIGDLPSFTQGARFPDYNGLLAGNQKMRWAYEAAEIARRSRMANSARTVESLRAQALLGGNPYLDLDIVAVSRDASAKALQPGQPFRHLYEHLDDALKAKALAAAVARNPAARPLQGPA